MGKGPFPGVVAIHHLPGWDEWYREATRKLAHHGFATISPDLYHRAGPGTPEDVAAKIRADGGVADDQVVGDLTGAMNYLRSMPYHNGKVGYLGHLLGRAPRLSHRLPLPGLRRGGRVLGRPRGGERGRPEREAARRTL